MKETVEVRVAEILRGFAIVEPPVPVEEIARRLGIAIYPLPAGTEISGAIAQRDGSTIIGVNIAHHPNRQRFTIAHELGHHLLGHELKQHVDGDFRVAWRSTESSKAVNWMEIEANALAAELLIPTAFIKRDLDILERQMNSSIVEQLARRYKVSRQAMEIRLTNLGLIPPY